MLIEMAALAPLLAVGLTGLVRSADSRELRALSGYLLAAWGVGALIVLSHSPLVAEPARIERFEQALTLLCGPLLLTYTRAATGHDGRFLPHLLPAFAWFAWAIVALFFEPELLHAGAGLFLLHQMAYTIAATALLLRRGGHSLHKPLALTWARSVVMAVWLVHAASVLRLLVPDPALRNIVPATAAIAFAVVLAALAVHGGVLVPSRFQAKYARAGRDASQLDADASALRAYLAANRPHRDRELSSETLARQLRWTEQRLSQVFNVGLGRSYAEVIRAARLDEAKRLLADPANARYSVEGIGLEAGFPSRASFYSAFKELEATSPSQFRKDARARPH